MCPERFVMGALAQGVGVMGGVESRSLVVLAAGVRICAHLSSQPGITCGFSSADIDAEEQVPGCVGMQESAT